MIGSNPDVWNQSKAEFDGSEYDLIEAVFEGLDRPAWSQLFAWFEGRVRLLENQHGRDDSNRPDFDQFISGKISYLVYINSDKGVDITLRVIEPDMLDFDIEKSEINTLVDFQDISKLVNEIGSILQCMKYYLCQEFQNDLPFLRSSSS